MSVYGGTMLPPHPPMAEGPGGPMYNGLHTADPAWSPIIKVVPNNADNSDPQQQVCSIDVESKLEIELWVHICIGIVQRFPIYWPSLPSGVAWYLGSSCGQCAPEPCQLELRPQQSNAHSMTHGANMNNQQRNTTEYDK